MRNMISLAILSLASIVLIDVAARSAAAEEMMGNVAEGLKFARLHCADCHQIEPGQVPPVIPAVKSFVDIAADPKMTVLALTVFLRTPHFDMPDFVLSEAQTDDVIAYILSLK